MKPLRLFPALLLVLSASCQKEQTDLLNTQGLTIASRTMTMNGETAVEATWEDGDCMGVFFGDATSAVEFDYNGNAWSTATTSVSNLGSISAYTPWGNGSEKNSVTILADQSYAENIRKSDFLYAEGENATLSGNELNLTFKHRLSQLIINYTYVGSLEKGNAPTGVQIMNQSITYSNSEGTWTASGSSNIIPLVSHDSEAGKGTIEAILVPQSIDSNSEFITFTINNQSYKVPVAGIKFESGAGVKINLNIGPKGAEITNITCSADWQVTSASGTLTEIENGYEYDEESNTYYIYNAKGLEKWRASANDDASVNAKLMNDIVLPDLTGEQESNWGSIGRTESKMPSYNAVFDGNGKKISNIIMDSNWSTGAGFIATMNSNGVVKNLTLEYTSLKCTNTAVSTGGIVGKNVGGTIEGCIVKGNIQGGSYAGGIVGNNTGKVTGCTLLEGSTISSINATGGIVGYADGNDQTVENCHVYDSNLSASTGTAGGIIGELKKSHTIIACGANANLTGGTNKGAAGIVGTINAADYNISIYGCYYNGTLISTQEKPKPIGGIVGNSSYTSLNIVSCYSIHTYDANNGSRGGIIAYVNNPETATTNVTESYSTQKCEEGRGVQVTLEGMSGKLSGMNTKLSDNNINWQYVASDNNPFPMVIQPNN